MPEDALTRIQHWYARQCDGDWEHGYGLTITTLDNPGWRVRIELTGTALQGRPFAPVQQDLEGPDWLRCEVKEAVFQGHGGPAMLGALLNTFLDWADS